MALLSVRGVAGSGGGRRGGGAAVSMLKGACLGVAGGGVGRGVKILGIVWGGGGHCTQTQNQNFLLVPYSQPPHTHIGLSVPLLKFTRIDNLMGLSEYRTLYGPIFMAISALIS